MTTDLELVSARVWTDEELRTAVATAWARQGLPEPQVSGDVATNLFVEVATVELELQIFRPRRRTTLAGPRWVTSMAIAASSSDELVAAVLEVAGDLARRCQGHLTVDGEVVDLDGVPAPTREVLTSAAPDPNGKDGPPPFPQTFAAVMLDVATAGEEGWRSMVGALGTWVGQRRDWLPRWWERDEEWEPFDPDCPSPDFWPMETWLSSGGGVAEWMVEGAGFADDVFSQIHAELRVPVDATAALLDSLAGLHASQPVYAMVHPWNDAEPYVGSGPRPGRAGENPYLSLSPFLLTKGLPNLYWGNLLGDPWVSAIGAERIASAPVHQATEILPGRWVLQLTERPSDVLTDWAGFNDLRERVKEHLGADLFRQDDGSERLAPRLLELPTLSERELVE